MGAPQSLAVNLTRLGVFQGSVAGQPVGEQAHVGGAARIGVVAERHESRALAFRGARFRQLGEVAQGRALECGAKQDGEVVFACRARLSKA